MARPLLPLYVSAHKSGADPFFSSFQTSQKERHVDDFLIDIMLSHSLMSVFETTISFLIKERLFPAYLLKSHDYVLVESFVFLPH